MIPKRVFLLLPALILWLDLRMQPADGLPARIEHRVDGVGAASTQAGDSAQAVTAAKAWLLLVDSAKYEASLDSAAPLLRQIVGSPAGWQQFVTMARSRYPVSGERTLVAWEPTFVPEGAPEARYARATFRSGGPGGAHESIVLTLTPTGWRVAMYGIRGG
jgi:hypothetical protein